MSLTVKVRFIVVNNAAGAASASFSAEVETSTTVRQLKEQFFQSDTVRTGRIARMIHLGRELYDNETVESLINRANIGNLSQTENSESEDNSDSNVCSIHVHFSQGRANRRDYEDPNADDAKFFLILFYSSSLLILAFAWTIRIMYPRSFRAFSSLCLYIISAIYVYSIRRILIDFMASIGYYITG